MATKTRSSHRSALVPAVLLAALIVLLPLVIFTVGRHSGAFTVRHVAVSGAEQLPASMVTTLLERAYLGHNLFTIDAAAVRKTLAAYTYLADVTIDRDFPSTLRVNLIEYQPAVYLLSGQDWYVVSREGRVLTKLKRVKPTPATKPSVTAKASPGAASPTPGTTASPSPGDSPPPTAGAKLRLGPPNAPLQLPLMRTASALAVGTTVTDGKVLDALRVLAVLPAAFRRDAAVVTTDGGTIVVEERAGLKMAFGDASRLDAKMLSLRAVLARYASKHVTPTLIDVSVPDRPIASPML
jgi:hypothetical protein